MMAPAGREGKKAGSLGDGQKEVYFSMGGKDRRTGIHTQVLPDEAAFQSACCTTGRGWASDKGEGISLGLGITNLSRWTT